MFFSIFENLSPEEKIVANISDMDESPWTAGVSAKAMTMIHRHLNGSQQWKHVNDWQTEVAYTIVHPEGDITAFDASDNTDARVFRESVFHKIEGKCGDKWKIGISRVVEKPFGSIDFNMTKYSRVRVMRSKYFHYETPRSCWCFKLSVQWTGDTLEEAKKSGKTFVVNVESVKNKTVPGQSSKYTLASFFEKILDIVSVELENHGRLARGVLVVILFSLLVVTGDITQSELSRGPAIGKDMMMSDVRAQIPYF